MSEVWLNPGTHAVRFYESASARHISIAEFFTANADESDPLLLMCRRATFDGVAALLASSRYGPAVAADRILFADAEDALRAFMIGDTIDPARGETYLTGLLTEARRHRPHGTIRMYGEVTDVLCERGNFAAALALEGTCPGLFAFDPRLTVLCGYARARFDGAGAVHLHAVCSEHTHAAPAEERPDPLAQGESPPQTDGIPSGQFVYIVDDDASVCRALGRLLKLTGRQVRTFQSGEAFLDEVDNLAAGCLVIDIQLGGMTGLAVLAHMNAAHPGWSAVAMSGLDGARNEALRLGARTFLHKPFEPQALLDAVAQAFA